MSEADSEITRRVRVPQIRERMMDDESSPRVLFGPLRETIDFEEKRQRGDEPTQPIPRP